MQKTAYEMRISDWSSGVCSSDRAPEPPPPPPSAAVARSERMAAESAELARTMGLPPEPRTVVHTLAEKVSGVTPERRQQHMETKKTTEKPARANGEPAEHDSQAKQAGILQPTQHSNKHRKRH